MKQLIRRLFRMHNPFNSSSYWEKRYARGETSGDGSYGRLAIFKASVVNEFIVDKNIGSAIEFGCGDGHQLSLISYPKYLGFDVSATVIRDCIYKFNEDQSKSFMYYNASAFRNHFIQADLVLSLDVIYHIVEEEAFQKYLCDVFASSAKYVLIYSTNFDKNENAHVLHRQFTRFVEESIQSFELVRVIKNPFPGMGEQESEADFFIYKKR